MKLHVKIRIFVFFYLIRLRSYPTRTAQIQNLRILVIKKNQKAKHHGFWCSGVVHFISSALTWFSTFIKVHACLLKWIGPDLRNTPV